MYRKILVTLDGSKLAEAALPHVEMLAKYACDPPPDVVLLMVCEPLAVSADLPGVSMPSNWAENVKHVRDEIIKAAQKYLSTVQNKLREAGIEVQTEVLTGDPASEIIKYATDKKFNLLVMATHGRSGVKRLALGSVTNKVLHSLSIPIFLAKEKQMATNEQDMR